MSSKKMLSVKNPQKKESHINIPAQSSKIKFTYVYYLIITLVFMFFGAYNTSPLISFHGEDSGMYLLMGRCMSEGSVLYTDLFDHKGPLIFFLNALPHYIVDSPAGVWAVEIIFMFISLLLLHKIATLLTESTLLSVSVVTLYLGTVIFCFHGGNYTEEYCGLFSLLSIYIFVLWNEHGCGTLSRKAAFALGMGLAFAFFMRPNNIVVIAGIILVIGVFTLRHQPKLAVKYTLFLLLGIATVMTPILIYHGIHHNIYEMFYATILHNIDYCVRGMSEFPTFAFSSKGKTFFVVSALLLIICIHSGVCCFEKQTKGMRLYGAFLFITAPLTLISILLGGMFSRYYMVLFLPIAALALMLMFRTSGSAVSEKLRKFFPGLLASSLILSALLLCLGTNSIPLMQGDHEFEKRCKATYEIIAEEQAQTGVEQTVFGYNTPAAWFYHNHITPPFKYFTMQPWMSRTNPQINEECCRYVEENKPMWIVTYFENGEYVVGEETGMTEIIKSDYYLAGGEHSQYLYRRNADAD